MMYEVFMQRVMHRTGIEDRSRAREVIDEVLLTLGEGLMDAYAIPIAEQLPEPLGDTLIARHQGGRELVPDTLYREVSENLDMSLSVAMEQSQVVCQVLAEAIDGERRQFLRLAMSPEWHELFEPRQAYTPPPKPDHSDRRTLATGSPGSKNSLSEAGLAHRNSIAASERPHEGSKLSSSHGKPSGRTLAEGKPGSSRPLSEGE
ncbi:MAG: DUF2267 domain-containing protein [Bradymonadaceae bacterium]